METPLPIVDSSQREGRKQPGGEFTAASGAHSWIGFIFILQKFTNEEEVTCDPLLRLMGTALAETLWQPDARA